ncbi:MAG: VOC family protein [Pseudomonadota bacterium]
MRIQDALAPYDNSSSVVRSEYLSHGTLEVYSLKESRKFYEEFLGFQCVRHARPAMAIRCGMRFHIVCLEVGDLVHPCNVDNHWGIDVGSAEEVDRIWQAANDLKDKYGIREVRDLVKQHGVYSFYLEDRDHNWWEFQYYDGVQNDDMFDFGDRYEDSGISASATN